MSKAYVLAIDQSTQGTKSVLTDEDGRIAARADIPHRQLIHASGWVSHDVQEIYDHLLQSVCAVIERAAIDAKQIRCIGLSNQRETTAAWNRLTGEPICDAIVWQCSRSQSICERIRAQGSAEDVRQKTGIPLSPYFPASKIAWILENVPSAAELMRRGDLCVGTMDTWLIWRMTNRRAYKTDYSNASRTQLMSLADASWSSSMCDIFGLPVSALPEICDSDSVFGWTDLEGILPAAIPICGALGDSHAALLGQGCIDRGMAKATYGTGSSVMMNTGDQPVVSTHGLVTSLAWKRLGKVQYVMEGNINYTGSVISWLKDELGLIASAQETQYAASQSMPDDKTYFVPAFTGLGAPHWRSDATALLCGMSRLTGKNEMIRAALDSIAYQIADVVWAMEKDTGVELRRLKVDGGPTRNAYLMQFESDILRAEIQRSDVEELSAVGAAFLSGISAGLYDERILQRIASSSYQPTMDEETRAKKISGWESAVRLSCAK